jgi:hypothetical protein
MKTRTALLLLVLLAALCLLQPATTADELEPIDYTAYYELLPLMKEGSEWSNESIRNLHTLMTKLEQTVNEDEAAGIRAQIRPLLVEHKKMKEKMANLVDRVLLKPDPQRTNEDALRALRNTTLRRVSWNNAFLKYVARDISQAIGVPIRLNAKVQELNQVEINFPEVSAEGVMALICQNFDLKWIIFEGEFIVLKKIGPNEARFIEWEKTHGKVDWIAEDKAGTYESDEVATPQARRELKKLENMDLPLLKQNMTKMYILEGESKRHETRLKELEMNARSLDMLKREPANEEERQAKIKRHKHILHYLYMERENSVEVWDVINQVLGEQTRLADDDAELRQLLSKEIRLIEWNNKDLESALYELGQLIGVPVEVELPANVEMAVTIQVENVTVETVISLICDIHPLDWRYVGGRLFFAGVQ